MNMRKAKRWIEKYIEEDGAHCSICRGGFGAGKTYLGGLTAEGEPALVGPCCNSKLMKVICVGVYDAPDGRFSSMLRGAGITVPMQFGLEDNAWKDSDREWFAGNPHRSHRLRPLFDGEGTELKLRTAPGEGYRSAVVVRQIEPGWRVRLPFWQCVDVSPPDEQATLHAIFDLLQRDFSRGLPLITSEVEALAAQYRRAARA